MTTTKRGFRIFGTAPTVYQLDSLRIFGYPVKKTPGGSFYVEEEFKTREEATQSLKDLVEVLYQRGTLEEDEYTATLDKVGKYGQMSYDAATVKILDAEEFIIP